LVFAFEPRDNSESGYEGRLIELQIRSRLQHSWATAVEAAGLYRGENLKSGVGNEGWLNFFELMSLEIAGSEEFLYAMDGSNSRIQERIDLDATLSAS
jgi:hypothetical protein